MWAVSGKRAGARDGGGSVKERKGTGRQRRTMDAQIEENGRRGRAKQQGIVINRGVSVVCVVCLKRLGRRDEVR